MCGGGRSVSGSIWVYLGVSLGVRRRPVSIWEYLGVSGVSGCIARCEAAPGQYLGVSGCIWVYRSV